jgi:hypothetical protein
VVKSRRVALALLLAGCARAGGPSLADTAPVLSEPLSSFATLRMIVFPVQSLRGGDALGWAAKAGNPRAFLAVVDSALETEFRDRGLGTTWAMPSDLARTAKRNPTYATDPSVIRAGDASRVIERRRDGQIPEPVASQMRALAGFHDARHALVPVELRFEPAPVGADSGQRLVLHVVVLDVRGSRLAWVGDVAGAAAKTFSPAMATELARRFADLVVAR